MRKRIEIDSALVRGNASRRAPGQGATMMTTARGAAVFETPARLITGQNSIGK